MNILVKYCMHASACVDLIDIRLCWKRIVKYFGVSHVEVQCTKLPRQCGGGKITFELCQATQAMWWVQCCVSVLDCQATQAMWWVNVSGLSARC